MKQARAILSVVFLANFCHAQESGISGSPIMTRPVSSSAFLAEVQRELTTYKQGAFLYTHCDVFARMINRRAAWRLGMQSSRGESPMSEQADTSYANDISNSEQSQNETTIAISRKNPKLIVAGANDDDMYNVSMPAYVSTNSGNTWKTYRLPLVRNDTVEAFGDPIVATDDSGNFYYSFLIDGYDTTQISDIMVARSSDGIHWKLGSPVLGSMNSYYAFEDKEIIAVDADPASPYYGRLYIAWNQFNDTAVDASHLLAYSDDKGETWSAPRPYTQTYGYFPLLRVGENGTVFIASSTEDDSNGLNNSDGMTVSTDGGETFFENPIANYILYPPQSLSGYPVLKGDTGFRAFPYVAYDVNRSNNAIYAVYGSYDDNNADAALFAVESFDEGRTWGEDADPVGTPALLGHDHFMPWVSHDDLTGQTYISMYSSEEDALNIDSRAVRCDFQSPGQMQNMGVRLFDPLIDTAEGWDFIGDYTGNDAYDGYFAAAWTENRPQNFTNSNIFAYVASPLSGDGVTRQINREEFDVSSPSPNPSAGGTVSITITSSEQASVTIRVFDLRGNEVLTRQQMMDPSVPNIVTLDTHAFMAGVYHTEISCGTQLVQRDLVVLL